MPEAEDTPAADRRSAIWSGTVSFGLVSVPVNLLPANREDPIRFRMVTADGTPLARRYFSAKTERPLDDEDIVRGYEVKKGKYVIVDDEELERLAPELTRDIDLRVFVPAEDIDPIYFERAYYLTPADKGSTKAYRLLARVMEETGRAGIATFVMRAKEYIAAILADNGILRVETLRFADELRSPKAVGLPTPPKVKPAEVRKIEAQIKRRAKTSLDSREMADKNAERVLAVVKRKLRAGKDVVELPPDERDEQSDVVDIMEVLQKSLKAGKRRRAS